MTDAPVCPYCNQPAALKQGKEIYGTPRYAASRYFWHCRKDSAWVRCFGKTTRPLGPLADQYLRTAQKQLDELRIMPLWITADQHQHYEPEDDVARERIRLSAKARVEAFLAMRLEFEKRTVKAVALNLEQCRDAWRALTGVSFADVRNWWYRDGRHKTKPKSKPKMGVKDHATCAGAAKELEPGPGGAERPGERQEVGCERRRDGIDQELGGAHQGGGDHRASHRRAR